MGLINTEDYALKNNIRHSRLKTAIQKSGKRYFPTGNGGYMVEESDCTAALVAMSKIYRFESREAARKRKAAAEEAKRSAEEEKKKKASGASLSADKGKK